MDKMAIAQREAAEWYSDRCNDFLLRNQLSFGKV